MNESNDKQGKDSPQPEKKLRCDQKQLELLLKCSEKKDMTEWNNWREQNWFREEIWLQGANLEHAHLEGAYLVDTHLERANFQNAYLEGADFLRAHLEGAVLWGAHLEGADLDFAYLEGANLCDAHLEGADLDEAHLKGAWLSDAHLEGAKLAFAHLEGADLVRAHLEKAYLDGAHLEGVDFAASVVDGLTLFWSCSVDRKTDFRNVGLNSCRIDEPTKHLLQYNIRRMNWEDWYMGKIGKIGKSEKVRRGDTFWVYYTVMDELEKKWVCKRRQLLTFPVRLFWFLSDYGRSTIRILLVFLALAIVFAVAYWWMPDCVMVNGQVGALRNFLHSLYFSVVTMTTLGFGDIAANPQSSLGQVLLMLQVFCGYFLLGAIVTRLSILFTAGGPTGRFSKSESERIK